MKRHFPYFKAGVVLAALLLIPFVALAQGPYDGVYFGTFEGPHDYGEFGLIVDDESRGILAVYDALDDRGFIEEDFYIRSDGSFLFLTRDGTRIEGQVSSGEIAGRYVSDGIEGDFAGLRAADDGPLRNGAGYYSGPVSITESDPTAEWVIHSRMVAIIAADGSAFFMLDSAFPGLDGFDPGFGSGHMFPGYGPFWPGGFNFDLDLDIDLGVDLDLDIGRQPPRHTAPGYCGPFHAGRGFGGWPFNFNWNYSLSISIFWIFDFDLDFNYHLPTCHSPWAWNQFPAPVGHSGGMIDIETDGHIQGVLLDGVLLEGYLDPLAAQAQGILLQQQGDVAWNGHWQIERQSGTGSIHATQHMNRLSDVNGDGLSDITWHHAVTGENAVWLMDGAEILAELPFEVRAAALPQVAVMREPVGDSPPDLSWQRQADGTLAVWLGSTAEPVYVQPELSWRMVGGGDFDGDGSMDILWRDETAGTAMVTLRAGAPGAQDFPLAADVARDWQLAAIGDLDGDGTDSLVWRHRLTGENTVWRIAEGQVAEIATLMLVPDVHWTIQP